MKIIDAHMHLFHPNEATNAMAKAVGHENSVDHLRREYQSLGIAHGVVMGNRSLDTQDHNYPRDLFHYCIGLDSFVTKDGFLPDFPDLVEENLKRDSCCGVKLYPGYCKLWLSDKVYEPIYALAKKYEKPVAVHMGLTNGSRAHLKYSHPMVLDEVAADHRKVRFVMCHFGNPFLETAAAVLEKNPNVVTDLSGLLDGRVNVDAYFRDKAGYVGLLQTWLGYLDSWDRVLYGTDWPIVNLREYVQYIARLVPEKHREKVFFHNANAVYQLGIS